jgi:hypothetical protein
MDITCELDGIGADYVISQYNAVGGVAVAHKKTVVTDDRLFAIGRSEMNGGEFTYHRTLADFHIRARSFFVLKILRLHPNTGVWVYLA